MSPAEVTDRTIPGSLIDSLPEGDPRIAVFEEIDGEWRWEPSPEQWAMIEEAERSVELHGTVDGETFFRELGEKLKREYGAVPV